MIRWRLHQEATVGIFFVRQKSGQFRIIIDTRCVNYMFVKPEYIALPTAGASASIEIINDIGQLYFAEGDVCDVLHHIGLPVGLDEIIVLPAVPAHLVVVYSIDGIAVGPSDLVSPSLVVLPMGWS
jgi:hypothetical protein